MAKRILVVDDNDDLLALLAEALGDEGYEVTTCSRARDAYSMAKSTRPDLILLDMLMPGMNGWEVLNVLLLDRDLRHVSVTLMTAAASEVRRRLARLEINDVSILDKPFGLDRLLEQVEQDLGNPTECEALYDKIVNLVTPLPQARE